MKVSFSYVPPAATFKRVSPSAAIIIPTLNASRHWERLHGGLRQQGIAAEQVLIIDSSSTDETQQLVRDAGYRIKVIPRNSFRHGATRQMAAELVPQAEIVIYLTQDAIPIGPNSFRNLLKAFDDPCVSAAYGRQLPRDEADSIERHARLFNYPAQSEVRNFESRHRCGMKAAFFSNSFAAYRRSAFMQVGGFPRNSIVSEEVTVAARMLMAGWKVAYQADATVIHSHPLGLASEFSRYFDIGVHHGREFWLLETFGHASGEGGKFVLSEMQYLWRTRPAMIPWAALRTLNKLCGYQMGKHEAYLPEMIKEMLSAQPHYWQDGREEARALQAPVVTRV